MLIACKCLNLVAASSNSRDISENNSSERPCLLHGVNLDELQKQQKTSRISLDCVEFLRQAIGPLTDLSVTVNQSDLIYKVPIDSWFLHYCINCNTLTHAKNATDDRYLINSNLLTNNEEICSLKSSKSFSTIFDVLMIDHQSLLFNETSNSTTGSDTNNLLNVNYSNNRIKQTRVKNLTEHFNNRLQKEIFETDERIRRYTEQQFALLKSFRDKAEQEYKILVSLVNEVPEQLKVIDAIDNLTGNCVVTDSAIENTQSLFILKQQQQLSSLDTPPATPDSTPMSVGNSPTFRQQTGGFGGLPIRSAQGGSIDGGTLDSDCLFELEGMENYPISVSNAMSDVEETEDAEDALGELDSTIQIPRSTTRKAEGIDIAKSLPISIANNARGRFSMENLDDDIPEDSNVDIAASIKALAKSVHGDTVFGDLPRPRFSTQI